MILFPFFIPKFLNYEKIYYYMNNRYRINKYLDLTYDINMLVFIGSYWIIQSFLVHYQIVIFSNIAIAILDFSLLLPI